MAVSGRSVTGRGLASALVLAGALLAPNLGCTTLAPPATAAFVHNLTDQPWTFGPLPSRVVDEARSRGLTPTPALARGQLAPGNSMRLWKRAETAETYWLGNGQHNLVLSPQPLVGAERPYWPRWFRSFHDRAAAVVGDVVVTFDPFGSRLGYVLRQRPAAPKHPNRLVVLVYNAFFLDGMFATGVDTRGPALIDYLRDGASRWDVLVLAELFHEPTRRRVLSALAELYPYAATVVGKTRERIGTGGLQVLSRWPILVEDEVIFRTCTDADCGAAKGGRYLRLLKGERTFHLLATHLQAVATPRAQRIRLQQVQQLAELAAAQNIDPAEPLVVAGDFNIDLLVAGQGRGQGQTEMERLLDATPVVPAGPDRCRYSYDPRSNPTAGGPKTSLPDQVLVARRRPARRATAVLEFPVVAQRGAKPRYRLLEACDADRRGALDVSDHYALTVTLDFD